MQISEEINKALSIRVSGLVQGVGFRPNVWRLAQECQISGTVLNDSAGVLIQAWGTATALQHFLAQLQRDVPPLARIDSLQTTPLNEACLDEGFRIIASESGDVHTGIVPDAALCAACCEDVFEPSNRRYRYPFTNCTHCGPRLSIVQAIPYDRANTSMSGFALCAACLQEYQNPADRRFHAQPNACASCGPTVWLEDMQGQLVSLRQQERDCIDSASRLLREGKILALMGLGGVHLVCDATQETSVQQLRQRKRRYQKPLALMARDTRVIQRYCQLNDLECDLLQSSEAPIVLLERQSTADLAASVAPQQQNLGVMLPYTPLHALLLADWDTPLVMTSANLSEEPQCIHIEDTRQRMQGIADYLLLHDRPIMNRVDDSVARVLAGQPRVLRRARGYAPAPLPLPAGFENANHVLAMGGELKNTFALVRDGQVVLSQHLGDLEELRTWREYEHTLRLYQHLFAFELARSSPTTNLEGASVAKNTGLLAIVVDKHPAYRSTQLGQQWAAEHHLPLHEVQHHHAHIAACMAENAWGLDAGKVLGVVLDGLGYGDDATFWGGEFLLVDYCQYERLGHFKPVAMPGGTKAILEPWRNLWAQLDALGWESFAQQFADVEAIKFLQQQPLATLQVMVERGLNSPLSSSCGRLCDAVAAALGCCREAISYEGQAAIELEALVDPTQLSNVTPYPLGMNTTTAVWQLDTAPMWQALFTDLQLGVAREQIAARFHAGLIDIFALQTQRLCQQHTEIAAIALSGGVFQNAILFTGLLQRLQCLDVPVLTHAQVPCNDGGLALGQAAIGAALQIQAY